MRIRTRTLILIALSFAATTAAQAAGNDLPTCLDVYTKLEAGGDATDKELTTAQQACARLLQTTQTSDAKRKTDAAAAAIAEEQQRRGKPR
jgi:hypothetical protein